MKGKAPTSIITDGDRQMKYVIEQVFPEAHHRLCAWHLLQNATSNIGKPKFTRMFRDCVLGDYEVGTFQRKWFEMVEKFGIADKRWVQDMYERRHSWATAHIRGKFFARFRTTSRVCAMRVVDSEDNGSYFIHTISRYGTPGKDWRVVAMSDLSEVRCTCMRMECFGVLCEHIIAVLVLNNVHEIPSSLILPRWTKDAKVATV
ncbi:protein FAR1-RELATED SEQUENCE 5-like [Arachis hypogaea]|uniref:protein FAR1-RELATED SEQUENCE 5-like n=1 Tax=Arachis hypogaea TaxID=3818 RepID=UPI000DED3FB4|nr:protein FAR1-RELATED SEQUENCE 12-like [Arachis hypogaea]